MDISSLFRIPIADIILWFLVFLFSLSLHESAHAWTSERFGDDTGRYQGRITLNPLAHIDWIGTILIPLFGFMNAGFSFFGWAKPVETNPLSWRNRKWANIWVAAAGPISNMILAIIAFVTIKILMMSGVLIPAFSDFFTLVVPASPNAVVMGAVGKILSIMLTLNIGLAVFNLIPVPPLDGSHILESLLPDNLAEKYASLRPFGLILLVGLMFTGVFSLIVRPVYMGVLSWL